MLGWIALNQREVRAIAKRLASPGSVGTVDELGLGLITDTLAQDLFPAFTTLMTRARYFIFARGVFDLAATQAWEQLQHTRRDEELHSGNLNLLKEFKDACDRNFEDIELCICLVLTLGIATSDDGATGGEEENGIIGRRNVGKRIKGKSNLPYPPLFQIRDRYPSALYFSGIRRMQAFKEEVSDLDHLWELYFATYLQEQEAPIWDRAWTENTEVARKAIKKVFLSFLEARKAGTKDVWEKDAIKHLSLSLSPNEAQFLRERLGSAGKNAAVTISIVDSFLDGDAAPEPSEEGYDRLSATCKQQAGKRTLKAAGHAMRSMKPALTLYQNLRSGLDPKLSQPRLQEVAIKSAQALDFGEALGALNFLLGPGKPSAGWGKADRALKFLRVWLHAGKSAKSADQWLTLVQKLILKENSVVNSRGKIPRLVHAPLGLTIERGRKERARQVIEYDENNPPEALSPSGRLFRAIQIFKDIGIGLKASA